MLELFLSSWSLPTKILASVSPFIAMGALYFLNKKHHKTSALMTEIEQQTQRISQLEQAKTTLEQENQEIEKSLAQEQLNLAVNQQKRQDLTAALDVQDKKLEAAEQQNQALQQSMSELKTLLATEQTSRTQQQAHMQEKLDLIEANKAQLLEEFEQLSNKIFTQKQQEFQQQSKEGLGDILTSFKEQLSGLQKKVEDVHLDDAKDRAGLKSQLAQLHTLNQQITQEAHALSTALRGENKTQGNWGELILEHVLESSGLREGHEYVREQSFKNDEQQRARPDVIINLPEGRHIIIDSKVSLNAYTDYVNGCDTQQKEQSLKAHIMSIKQHINGLSGKSYQHLNGVNSPDFVFLFMPIEPAFMLAFEADESLFNQAFEKRIVVVTPTTLLATLRTVASIWSIEKRNKNTEELADQAGRIYDKLSVIIERMDKLGSQLETAKKTYDETYSSFKTGHGNLISRVDKFRKLGVQVKKEMDKKLVSDALEESELKEESLQSLPLTNRDEN